MATPSLIGWVSTNKWRQNYLETLRVHCVRRIKLRKLQELLFMLIRQVHMPIVIVISLGLIRGCIQLFTYIFGVFELVPSHVIEGAILDKDSIGWGNHLHTCNSWEVLKAHEKEPETSGLRLFQTGTLVGIFAKARAQDSISSLYNWFVGEISSKLACHIHHSLNVGRLPSNRSTIS